LTFWRTPATEIFDMMIRLPKAVLALVALSWVEEETLSPATGDFAQMCGAPICLR